MTKNRRGIVIGIVLAAAGIALVLIPNLSAERFSTGLHGDLQRILGRRVEMGEVRFTLWGGPGFRVKDVVVADHDDMPAEPFAYVQQATMHLALSSLWTRELRFSRITLEQPSLNLAATPDGIWNYQRVLPGKLQDALAGESGARSAPLPELRIEGGRINFRHGLRKSEYYLRNADFRLSEEGIGSDAWLVEFRAEPARTDSYAPRFGTLRGSGRWRATAGPHGVLDIDVEVERSPVAELSALLGLSRVGMSGYLSARAHLSGPASALQLRGNVELRDSNSWSLLAGAGANRGVTLEGNLDLVSNRMQVGTVERPREAAPYAATLVVGAPEAPGAWQTTLDLKEIPVQSLQELFSTLNQSTPNYPGVEGFVSGAITYHSVDGLRGNLQATHLDWTAEGQPLFSLRDFRMELQRSVITGSAGIQAPATSGNPQPTQGGEAPRVSDAINDREAQARPPSAESAALATSVEASAVQWAFRMDRGNGEGDSRLSGTGIGKAHLQAHAWLVPGAPTALPLLEGDGWTGQGQLQFVQPPSPGAGVWQGQLNLRDLALQAAGMSKPAMLRAATLELRGASWQLRDARGGLAGIPFRMELSHTPGAAKPYRGVFRLGNVDLEALARLLPLSGPDAPGFLQRAFRRTSPPAGDFAPREEFHARIYLDSVLINGSKYTDFRADVFGHGRKVNFENISVGTRFGALH
ncbi:MAG: hypothetical protein MUF01_18550, partial [Bryobacterales bacterium]|nr:hypothetical protein [Bryobacterales bacterium]